MKHGSLFSGIGGFDLAAEWMGWENAFHCEYNPFSQRILKHYWPNAATYTDIRETDFTLWQDRIDILTGGFPCQPYSTAGKRRGKDDDRHLWPEMLRAIREVCPRWIVGENVRGIISWSGGLVFEEVQADLEAAGYEVQPFVLPAASVGAPHERYRTWFVAFNSEFQPDVGNNKRKSKGERMEVGGRLLAAAGRKQGTNNANSPNAIPNPHHPGSSTPGRGVNSHRPAQGEEREREPQCGISGFGCERDAPNPANTRAEGLRQKREDAICGRKTIADAKGIDSRAGLCGENNQRGTVSRPFAGYRNKPTSWQNFPTQPPVLPGDDGLSAPVAGYTARQWYNEHIKAAGNAIVPQVALQIFKAIDAYEKGVVF